MKIVIVGLGSMGKRRIRCLRALGSYEIRGVDRREDRRAEVSRTYNIAVFAEFETALQEFKPDALIISVPPDVHHIYMKKAVTLRIPFFVEASVVDTNMEQLIVSSRAQNVLGAPSATMLFHPGIQLVHNLVKEGALGQISNVIHHSGQYLPDWHTYEHVRDYYVSDPATGGAREIVPFELSWLTALFGFPQRAAGTVRRTIHIEGAEKIDDTYDCLFDYGRFLMVLIVDVVSRCATRRLTINGDRKQLVWDWDENVVRVFDPATGSWERLQYDQGPAAAGYNANIGERMYIEEIRAFLTAIERGVPFPNSLSNDHANLRLLYAVEESNRSGQFIPFTP